MSANIVDKMKYCCCNHFLMHSLFLLCPNLFTTFVANTLPSNQKRNPSGLTNMLTSAFVPPNLREPWHVLASTCTFPSLCRSVPLSEVTDLLTDGAFDANCRQRTMTICGSEEFSAKPGVHMLFQLRDKMFVYYKFVFLTLKTIHDSRKAEWAESGIHNVNIQATTGSFGSKFSSKSKSKANCLACSKCSSLHGACTSAKGIQQPTETKTEQTTLVQHMFRHLCWATELSPTTQVFDTSLFTTAKVYCLLWRQYVSGSQFNATPFAKQTQK